jgi:hypothetical protein
MWCGINRSFSAGLLPGLCRAARNQIQSRGRTDPHGPEIIPPARRRPHEVGAPFCGRRRMGAELSRARPLPGAPRRGAGWWGAISRGRHVALPAASGSGRLRPSAPCDRSSAPPAASTAGLVAGAVSRGPRPAAHTISCARHEMVIFCNASGYCGDRLFWVTSLPQSSPHGTPEPRPPLATNGERPSRMEFRPTYLIVAAPEAACGFPQSGLLDRPRSHFWVVCDRDLRPPSSVRGRRTQIITGMSAAS